MKLILRIENGWHEGHKVWLNDPQRLSIGGSEWSEYCVPYDKLLAPVHFSVTCGKQRCVIQDLGSECGTYLNSRRVNLAPLKNGDRVQGGKTKFLIEIEGQAQGMIANHNQPEDKLPAGPLFKKFECSSTILRYQNTKPLDLSSLVQHLGRDLSTYYYVNFQQLGSTSYRNLRASSFIYPNNPIADSRVLFAEDELVHARKALDESWGSDSTILVFAREPKRKVQHLIRQSIGSYTSAKLLQHHLEHTPAGFSRGLLNGFYAVATQSSQAHVWNIYTNPENVEASTLLRLGSA